MTISFLGGGTTTNLNATATIASATGYLTTAGAAYTAWAAGDLIVAVIVKGSVAVSAPTLPTGFTAAHTALFADSTDDTNLGVYYKFLTNTDASWTVPASGNAAFTQSVDYMCFRGVHQTTPLDGVTPITTTGISTSVPTAAAMTPATPGAWVIAAAGGAFNAVITNYTVPTGFNSATNQFLNVGTASGTVTYSRAGLAIKDNWVSGSVTPAWGGGTANARCSYATSTFSLRPARKQVRHTYWL